MELIRMKNVEKQYKNGVTAAYDVDLSIQKGEFVFIIGESGSGKSTVIKMLYREEKPTKGDIFVGGIVVSKLRNNKVYKLRKQIGVVFQDYKLLPKLNVYENVAFGLEMLGMHQNEVRDKVLIAINMVGLKNKTKSYPDNLSGGEQQRVAIARAIANEPKLLICDEPTGNLGPKMSMEIMEIIDNINKSGTTVIMATHNKDIVNKYRKRVILMKQGKIVKDYQKGKYEDEGF